jgi:integrase
MTKENIHGFEKRLKRALENLESLDKENKELIKNYYQNYIPDKPLSIGRKEKNIRDLHLVALIRGKPITDIKTEKEVKELKTALVNKGYKLSTYRSTLRIYKCFLKWTDKEKYRKVLEFDAWKTADPYKTAEGQLDPDSIPTEEDLLKMLGAGDRQTRCLLALLGGAGLRESEAALLKRKNIHFEEDGSCIVNISGKTGRNSKKIHAGLASYIKEEYAAGGSKGQEDYLISGKQNGHLSHGALRSLLLRTAVKAGLGKNVAAKTSNGNPYYKYKGKKANPHAWRHYHATWALDNLAPMYAKRRVWGNPHTRMDAIYHHAGRGKEMEAYDKATGNGQVKEVKKELLNPKTCFKCQKQYPPTTSLCPECNLELDYKTWHEKKQDLLEEMLAEKIDTLLEKKLDEKLRGK